MTTIHSTMLLSIETTQIDHLEGTRHHNGHSTLPFPSPPLLLLGRSRQTPCWLLCRPPGITRKLSQDHRLFNVHTAVYTMASTRWNPMRGTDPGNRLSQTPISGVPDGGGNRPRKLVIYDQLPYQRHVLPTNAICRES